MRRNRDAEASGDPRLGRWRLIIVDRDAVAPGTLRAGEGRIGQCDEITRRRIDTRRSRCETDTDMVLPSKEAKMLSR